MWIKFYYHHLLRCFVCFVCFFFFLSFFIYLFLQFVFRFYWALLTRLNVGCFKHHHSWCYESHVHDVMYAVVPSLLLLLLLLSLLRIVKFHTYNRYDVWMARSLCILCVSKQMWTRVILLFFARVHCRSVGSFSFFLLSFCAQLEAAYLLPLRLSNACTPNLECNKAKKEFITKSFIRKNNNNYNNNNERKGKKKTKVSKWMRTKNVAHLNPCEECATTSPHIIWNVLRVYSK